MTLERRPEERALDRLILELREQAKTALGPKFDLRAFHDQVLDAGALPLDVLGARIDAWIASQK